MLVKVVHGSPLSGKTTYVNKHKGSNDLIFDYDLIMSAISGRKPHDHNDNLHPYILEIRKIIIRKLKYERELDTAWIITTYLSDSFKEALKDLDYEEVHIDVTYGEAQERLLANPEGRNILAWQNLLIKYHLLSDANNLSGAGTSGEIDARSFYDSTKWRTKRKEVLQRDNYECQLCKYQGKYKEGQAVHHVKHLKQREDLSLTETNLVTLCLSCHNKVHPEKRFEIKKPRIDIPEKW